MRSIDRTILDSRGIKRSRKSKTLVLKDNGKYLQVGLSKGGVVRQDLVHRLVADAFLESSGKPCVNHKDSDRYNNHSSNLEWVTHKENSQHGVLYGNMRNNSKSYPIKGVSLENKSVIRFPSLMEAQRAGFIQACLTKCLSGRQNKHKGYAWSKDTKKEDK